MPDKYCLVENDKIWRYDCVANLSYQQDIIVSTGTREQALQMVDNVEPIKDTKYYNIHPIVMLMLLFTTGYVW